MFKLLQQRNATRWNPENLRKLASENFLRVFRAVEAKRDELITEEPIQDWVSKDDLLNAGEVEANLIQECSTFLEDVAIPLHNIATETNFSILTLFITFFCGKIL